MNPSGQKDFCLLIPCYNNYEGLITSLKTVDYHPDLFEVLIIDDGSSNPVSESELRKDLPANFPFTLLTNQVNSGITKSLNFGLKWIDEQERFAYVARLDCGDKCVRERFYEQVAVLKSDDRLGLIGSWCRFEDENGEGYNYKTSTEDSEIRKEMYQRNVFLHPSVMFTVHAAKKVGFYPPGYEYAEDYAFFWELINTAQTMVIKKILVIVEINKRGISFGNKSKQLIARWRVVNSYGSSLARKIGGFTRLILLFIAPKELTLRLKKKTG